MVKASKGARIGVISDTHGYLDPQVLEEFAGVDHIIHAGDIMDATTLDALGRDRAGHGGRRQHGRRQAGQAAARGHRQGRRRSASSSATSASAS